VIFSSSLEFVVDIHVKGYLLYYLLMYTQEFGFTGIGFYEKTWMPIPKKKEYGKEGNLMDIEYMLKLITNNGFPLVLFIYLVWKLEFFINEIIKNQKEFSQSVTVGIKEIKKTISDLRVDFAKNQ